jgi:predicted transcriptional regulator
MNVLSQRARDLLACLDDAGRPLLMHELRRELPERAEQIVAASAVGELRKAGLIEVEEGMQSGSYTYRYRLVDADAARTALGRREGPRSRPSSLAS